MSKEVYESSRHHLTNDGLKASLRNGCIDGWASLHLLQSLVQNNRLTSSEAHSLISEAHNMFGDCEQSQIFLALKTNFPEAFK